MSGVLNATWFVAFISACMHVEINVETKKCKMLVSGVRNGILYAAFILTCTESVAFFGAAFGVAFGVSRGVSRGAPHLFSHS